MFILSLLFAFVSFAPQAAQADVGAPAEPREVVVKDFYWGRVISRTFIDNPYAMSNDPWAMPRIRRRIGAPPAVILQRETYILVRNSGTRAVKSLVWDYVFYDNAKHERETKRFQFQSKAEVQPGEMKFITERVGEASPTAFGAVVVRRVEFEDGTVWQRSAKDEG